jgi:hypothetical protein
MQCTACHREMTPADPIYRVAVWDWGAKVEEFCAECCATKPKGSGSGWSWLTSHQWRRPEPCGKCGRPVICDKLRKLPKRVGCSDGCRRAIYGAIETAWRRSRVKALTCVLCGVSFMPNRSDARYCSAACKQKAFRQRKTA